MLRLKRILALIIAMILCFTLPAGCADNSKEKEALRSELAEYKSKYETESQTTPSTPKSDMTVDLDQEFDYCDLKVKVPGSWIYSSEDAECWVLADDKDIIVGLMQLLAMDCVDQASNYREMHANLDQYYASITGGFLQSLGVDPDDSTVRYEDHRVLNMPAKAVYTTSKNEQGDFTFSVLLMFTQSHYIYTYSLAMPSKYEETVRESVPDFINGVESFEINFREVPWPDTAGSHKSRTPFVVLSN